MKSKRQFHLWALRLFAWAACVFAALALSPKPSLAQSCVPPPSGMIDWWPADGDAWDVQGPHSGTLVNGASFTSGEVGQAFSFDVTQHQYVDVGIIALPVTFTISAWINPSHSVPGEYYQIINAFDGNGWYFAVVNGQLQALTETTAGGGATVYATLNPVITTGTWQHALVTYDGNAGPGQKFHFYVNGAGVAAISSNDQCSVPGTSSFSAKIGADASAPTFENFDGGIDELQLFDRVLSAEEIAAIYNVGNAGCCKPLLPVVSISTTIPNGAGNFISLLNASFNGSSVAFFGTGSGGQQGIYFKSPQDPCKLVADLNTAIPNGTGNFVSFLSDNGIPNDPCISGDNIVFYGTGSNGQRGIYLLNRTAPPSPITITDLNTAIPGGTGNFTNFIPPNPIILPNPIVSGDNVIFFGAGSGGQQGIYFVNRFTPSDPNRVADLNTAIPGGTGNFTAYPVDPCISGNIAGFIGNGSGGQQGIYIADITVPPSPIKIADTNTAIPGGTGNFTGFIPPTPITPSDPCITGSRLVFLGFGLDGQQGVYVVNDVLSPQDPCRKVADLSTAIPNGTGNFISFGTVSVSATDVAFIGNGSDGQTGIYDQTGGQLFKVITIGDMIGSKTITGLSLTRTGLVGDPIAFQATFDDGSQAIYVIQGPQAPSPTPTPTATPTATATATATAPPPSPTPTSTPTATATATPTATATATATATPTATPTPTATFTPTPPPRSPTPTPTITPTPTPTPTATAHQYAAQVQQPINADGSSVFSVRRGVVPVKFALTDNGNSTCNLPPATIAVTRMAGGTIGGIDESLYSGSADSGSNFRIDSCQYIYNLSASALGAGTYRVDIIINGQVVGTATFGLR